MGVAVVQQQGVFAADGAAQGREPRHGWKGVATLRHEQAAGFHAQAQLGGQHVSDAVHGRLGGLGKLWVCGLAGDPACAQHHGFQLIGVEHERRQGKARAQHVAQAGVAFNLRALLAQGGNVAVKRAQADGHFVRQHSTRYRLAALAQGFKQLQQAGGAGGHGSRRASAHGKARCKSCACSAPPWRMHGLQSVVRPALPCGCAQWAPARWAGPAIAPGRCSWRLRVLRG